jgi:hypothetical protein
MANNGRSNRYDSSLPQLLKRKEVYEDKMVKLKPHFDKHLILDNSGELSNTQDQFIKIINEVFPNKGEGYGRIHGHR